MPGRTTRPRPPRWQTRMQAAGTPPEELEVAYDRLRSALARHCRKQRDKTAAAAAEALAADVAREAARNLMWAAVRLEGNKPERVVARERR